MIELLGAYVRAAEDYGDTLAAESFFLLQAGRDGNSRCAFDQHVMLLEDLAYAACDLILRGNRIAIVLCGANIIAGLMLRTVAAAARAVIIGYRMFCSSSSYYISHTAS